MAKKTKDKGDGEAKPGGAKKLIVIGAAAAVLLAGGTGAGVFLLTKGDSASAADTKTEEVLVPGDVTALDPISVNLADGHYLKIGVALQQVESSGGEGHGGSSGLDGSKAYDLIINQYSNLSMDELENADQRNQLKDELQEKIITAYETEDEKTKEKTKQVMGIYLTSFVMQ